MTAKTTKKKVNRITAYYDADFHKIFCMQNDKEYGFFKSDADRRPSSAIYLKKEQAERLYELFTRLPLEEVKAIINKVLGNKLIPCGEFQDIGWICNEGHLCKRCFYKNEFLRIVEEEMR
jgi:hypothetical protein